MTNASDPAKASQDVLRAFEQAQRKSEQQNAEIARMPLNRHLPPGFESMCRNWIEREVWTLREAANLLCGYAPERPAFLPGAEETRHRLLRADPDHLPVINRAMSMASYRYRAADVLTWARRRDIDIPQALLAAAGHQQGRRPSRAAYETPLMSVMYEAIEQFWIDHKPGDPQARFPKQDAILDWLKTERGLNDAEARAIDLIIRHPSGKRL